MFWTYFKCKISRNISKVLVKNIKEGPHKCKTVIYIDGVIVFTSDAYTWKHPDNSRKEFGVYTGNAKKQEQGSISF